MSSIVLEFGSHSLKAHYQSRSSGILRKSRYAWDLGHEVYSRGKISKATAQHAVETIRGLEKKGIRPSSILAIATGALRDADNCKTFISFLEEHLGLHVRVISGREEASLLAQGYLAQKTQLPALITDIGGGSLEVVYIGRDKTILRDSLPLGAIRVHHFGLENDGKFNDALVSGWIQECFDEASVITADEIHCTGGTAKAIAKTFGRMTVSLEEVQSLEARIKSEGTPPDMRADRAQVFLPGVMVLRKLMEHAQAKCLTYLKVPVGRIFLQKHVQKIPTRNSPERRNRLLKDVRITQIFPQQASTGLDMEDQNDQGDTKDSGK